MLILSRKEGQSLMLDGNIVVRILEIRGNTIRIGIEAPEDVSIVRSELIGAHREQLPAVPVNQTLTV